ncbi:hypothetical protein [Myxococcus faecalis]|uniref:hypothetical protein n=1 Tax=Myxococcus faecalis TaxID=3115646 RepID=UPI003CF554D9
MRRHVSGFVAGLLVIAGCGVGPEALEPEPGASTSPAEVGAAEQGLLTLVTCGGTVISTFDPPLKNEPQDVVASAGGVLSNCLLSGLTATFVPRTGPIKAASCLDLLHSSYGTLRLIWSEPGNPAPGESEVLFSATVVGVGDVATTITDTGTVRSGRFAGATMVRVSTYANDLLGNKCASPEGLATLNGSVTFVLTRLL